MRGNVNKVPLLGTNGWRNLFLGLAIHGLCFAAVGVLAAEPPASSSCEGFLNPNFFQILIDKKVFISQFSPGVQRAQCDAICTPVAAANAAQALYFSLSGEAVFPSLLIDFVNEAWSAFSRFSEVRRESGLPFTYHPALALGAAQKVNLLNRVVPFGNSDPLWLGMHPEEIISTRSRVRVIGIKTKSGAHSILSLGFDFKTKELVVLDSNDASEALRMRLEQKDRKLYLQKPRMGENVQGLRPGLESSNDEFEVLSAFGLNLVEPRPSVKSLPPSANEGSFSAGELGR